MQFNRRSFIYGGGFVAGGLSLLSGAPQALSSALTKAGDVSGKKTGNSRWQSVRGEFALDPALIHMTGLLLASNPRNVRAAIDRHRKGLDANPVEYFSQNWADSERSCYETAARYMGTSPEQIALTDSTTMGLGMLYSGLILKSGQEILTSDHDHYATKASLKTKAETSGAVVRQISLYTDSKSTRTDAIVRKITAAISPQTRVLALTWVHSGTGVKIPVRKISDALATINSSRSDDDRIIFCVDGVHGFGIEDFAIEALGCDFFSAGCHKWIFGPRGTGVLWGRKESWKHVKPVIPSFNALFYQSAGSLMTPGGFHSFELRWSLPEAFNFHFEIGKDNVEKRIHALNSMLKVEMAKINGIKLYTPESSELSSGIVCFDIDGMTAKEVVEGLRAKKIIASTTPYDVSYARLTPGLLNNEKDIEVTIAALASLAGKKRTH